MLILNFKSFDTDLSLLCLYGPNKDEPNFYSNIKDKLLQINNPYILVGDFNLVINPEMDYSNFQNVSNPKAREMLQELILELDLIDCWREDHLEDRKYTWLRKNPIKQASLDFFLISSSLYTKVSDTRILPWYRTDHSAILLTLNMDNLHRGSSYWKLINALLKYIEYVNKIKQLIKRIKLQYASVVQPNNQQPEECSNNEILFNISDRLFLETLLREIQGGGTISYGSFKKRQNNDREEMLLKEIECLEEDEQPN